MRLFRKALFHTADILCGIPQRIVLRADQQQLSPDVFNGNVFFRLDRMSCLGIVKQLAGVYHIAGAFALGDDAMPIVGMLIAKRHIGQRLAPVGEQRLALDRPFLATVPFALHETLPHKIAGRHGNGQGNIREHGGRCQRERSRSRCTGNANFMVAVGFQPRNGRLHTLQRIIMMSVILFRRRHGEYIYAPPAEPFHGRTRKPVLRIVSNHRNDRAVRSAGTRPVRAVKADGLHIKVLMLHCFSLQIRSL